MRTTHPFLAGIVLAILVVTAAPASASSHEGSISGVVRDADGAPIEAICVYAQATQSYWWRYAQTRANGSYVFEDLPPDSYIVHYYDCGDGSFASMFYPGVLDREDATEVVVATQARTDGIDVVLPVRPVVTGRLTGNSGRPVSDTCVTAYGARTFGFLGSGYTQRDGWYLMRLDRPGKVKIQFGACGGPVYYGIASSDSAGYHSTTNHIVEWWDDQQDFERAAPVTLGWGERLDGLDAELTELGTIGGRVTDTGGRALGNVCVFVDGEAGNAAQIRTSRSGSFRFASLWPDTYRVRFSDCDSEESYRTEWFPEAALERDATAFVISSGTIVEGVNGTLTPIPSPELRVGGIRIENVPAHTDTRTLPVSGTVRTVSVTVANHGDGDAAYAALRVWVETATDGKTRVIGEGPISLAAGEAVTHSYRWDAFGAVGDATVHAVVCTMRDRNRTNNHARADTYAVAGGLGFGYDVMTVGVRSSDCSDFYY